MTKFLFFSAFALLFLTVLGSDDVVVGTKDNFDDIIGKKELTLVKFYAPWCGHCKKMAPDFKEAATDLKGKAVLVDLDATVEKDLASKYGIRGFPTLKLFKDGEVISDYKGGRTKEAIVKYITNALLPSYTDCKDADEVSKFVKDNEGKAIFVGVSLDSLMSDFKKTSMSLRDIIADSVAFAAVSDVAHVKGLTDKEVKANTIVVSNGDYSDVFSGEGSELEAWAKLSGLELFGELSRDTASLYTELGKPIFILFQDPDKKDDALNTVVTDIAKKHRSSGAIAFAWINSIDLKSFAEHVGVADKDPAIAIYEFASDVKYAFEEDYSADTLAAWVDKFLAGELTATTKSEPIPETNDEPVKVVVGDSWTDIVEDESKDVLIEQYAPWCGHCKKLAPVLDELAADLKGVETLVIAKMDATANDAPVDYKAQGFPTLHFFPAGKKKGMAYDGGRTKEDFIKFFKENATHKEGIEEKKDDGEKEEL